MKAFNSNPALVRHHLEKLLKDGKGHARKEIIDYVLEKSGGIGYDGKPLTASIISNSMNSWLKIKGNGYRAIRRGVYQYTHSGLTPYENILYDLYDILQQARVDIHGALQVDLLNTEITGEQHELLTAQGKQVMALLENAEQVLALDFLQESSVP